MSAATLSEIESALQQHITESTGGDLVVGFVAVAGIVTPEGFRTAYLVSSSSARWEVRGLLLEAIHEIDHPETSVEGG